MTREKQLQKRLLEISTSNFDSLVDFVAYCAGYMDGAKWADEHRWISVDEELPQKDVDVLMWSDYTGKPMVGYYLCTKYDGKHLFRDYKHDETWDDVTHWMPMPEPPTISKMETVAKNAIVGTPEHIQIALDVIGKKGGEE